MSTRDEEAKEAFALFDKRGAGTIPQSSLGDVLRALGQNPTQKEVHDLASSVGGDIDYQTFLDILNRPGGDDPAGTADEFIRGFQVFDKDGNGYIGQGELKYVLTSLGEKLSDDEVDELLKGVKVTPEGNINYVAFVHQILGQTMGGKLASLLPGSRAHGTHSGTAPVGATGATAPGSVGGLGTNTNTGMGPGTGTQAHTAGGTGGGLASKIPGTAAYKATHPHSHGLGGNAAAMDTQTTDTQTHTQTHTHRASGSVGADYPGAGAGAGVGAGAGAGAGAPGLSAAGTTGPATGAAGGGIASKIPGTKAHAATRSSPLLSFPRAETDLPVDDHHATHASNVAGTTGLQPGTPGTTSTTTTTTVPKPSVGDKISGKVDVMVGKLTHNPGKVAIGEIKQSEGKAGVAHAGLGGAGGHSVSGAPAHAVGSSLSSLLSRATDRIPPVSALPHLARQGAARVDPRQFSETLALQLTIKALSGCVQDRVALAREEQVFAKQLYQWSKDDSGADVVDTCDRLAWLAFKSSELEQDAAHKVEESRAVLKDIRNMENDLVPRRRNVKQLAARIAALEKEGAASKKADGKHGEQLAKLRAEHAQLEAETATFEASFAVLKRQKLHEAFTLQFAAQKELGEKLALVAGYGELLLQGMETKGAGDEYTGKDRSAQVKVELEEALASWTPSPGPKLGEQSQDSASLFTRSDTRSFGETHAPQLSELDSHSVGSSSPAPASHHRIVHPPPLATLHSEAILDTSSSRAVPPVPPHPASIPPPLPARGGARSPGSSAVAGGINLSPTSPLLPSSSPPHAAPAPVAVAVDLPPPGVDATPGLAPAEPTVAETGAPVVGTGGPASGVLRPRRRSEAASSVSSSSPGGGVRMPGTFNPAGWGVGPGAGGGAEEGDRLPAYGEGDDEAARARDQAEAILAREREAKTGGLA
ncbi:hypothetical protein JCM3770_001844 [Rhodotorula araucariae]